MNTQTLEPVVGNGKSKAPQAASLGDYLSQPHSAGGLGLGTIGTSALFLSAILGLVVYLAVTKRDALDAVQTPTQAA